MTKLNWDKGPVPLIDMIGCAGPKIPEHPTNAKIAKIYISFSLYSFLWPCRGWMWKTDHGSKTSTQRLSSGRTKLNTTWMELRGWTMKCLKSSLQWENPTKIPRSRDEHAHLTSVLLSLKPDCSAPATQLSRKRLIMSPGNTFELKNTHCCFHFKFTPALNVCKSFFLFCF